LSFRESESPQAEERGFAWAQVCRQNPGEKGKYIKIIVALLAVRVLHIA
jgi:hypothetical protein